MDAPKPKPDLETVLAYAKPIIGKFLSASTLPKEQKEEMEQEAWVRLVEAYPSFDPSKGWKSFTYTHVRGAILDYQKFGRGFSEGRWSLANSKNPARTPKLTQRVEIFTDGEADDAFDVDRALGERGVFNEQDFKKKIRWELLAKLASQDDNLHAFARFLRGQTIEEMAPIFEVVRTRVSQMIQEFLERFDNPECADNAYFKQVCFALGVCEELGMPDLDMRGFQGMSMGWDLNPVDLDWLPPSELEAQMDMFSEQEDDSEEDEE